MGKKNRFTSGAVGRRTILQLSPPGSRGLNSGETHSGSEGKTATGTHKHCGYDLPVKCFCSYESWLLLCAEGLSLLGAYEDSDDEDAGERAPVTSQHNQSADIDSTLADFMAEIDAITTQPTADGGASDITASIPAENNTHKSDGTETQPNADAAFEYNTQDSLAGVGVEMGDWQEVWDDNSGCYYYWNTVTNEVSWELPHYLADQVQSLGKHPTSSDVNGNAVVHDDHHTEEAATKDKEVIESVVALANELLGPLISSEVKEAEEKWRKRLLKGLDETEHSLDSDGEGGGSIESPSVALLDQDSALSEKDVSVKKQSTDNSDAEGPEEDTVELELALERKKAELRALEDGDGSAGGSSPCSEASQDATNSGSTLFKKKRWKTVFPAAPSPDSNSRSSNVPESTETGIHSLTKEEVETPELKFQIGELANTLTSKMEFLGINKKTISNFQLLLLQTETRIADWREGALNGMYLRRRLQEAAEHIKYYELNATPKGWSCHWDREHRRYFYLNERTGASQWDFPTEEDKGEDAKGGQSSHFRPHCGPHPNLLFQLPHHPPSSAVPLPDSDSEIMEVEMEMDDDDGEPPAPGTEEDNGPPLPPGITNTRVLKKSYLINGVFPAASIIPVAAYWGVPAVPLVPSEPPMPPQPPLPPLPPPQPPSEPPPPKPTEKIKKTKNKSKKVKTKMPSLVKKWQSIQKELDEEEKSSSSDDDRDLLNKKSIEEWKYQQLMTGKASKNANFEAIPDNWRERIKKRKMMNST
uniref:WW domain-containing protein n=1 Tax=Periophthalmus magnuspinnatus TaxID=409849 RepID=A0A3B4A462_9GOBI